MLAMLGVWDAALQLRDILEPFRFLLLGFAILSLFADCYTTTIFLKIPNDYERTRLWVWVQARWPRAWPVIFLASTWLLSLGIFIVWLPGLVLLIAIEIFWVIKNVLLIERTEAR